MMLHDERTSSIDDGKLLPELNDDGGRDLLPTNTKVFVSTHRWQRVVWKALASGAVTTSLSALFSLAGSAFSAIAWLCL